MADNSDHSGGPPLVRTGLEVTGNRKPSIPRPIVLAWLAGALLICQAIYGLANLVLDWSRRAEIAQIDFGYSPWPPLIGLLVVLLIGVLVVMRRRLVFIPLVMMLAIMLYAYFTVSSYPEWQGVMAVAVAEFLAVLAVCVVLQLVGRLR